MSTRVVRTATAFLIAAFSLTGAVAPVRALAADNVVRIGAPYPLTGAWAEGGQGCLNGMELAADEINRAGGIEALKGAKIEIDPVDTGSTDPTQAQSVTAELIGDKKVSALVGAYVSSLSLTVSTAAEQAKVPMLTQSYVDTLTQRGYQYLFQLPPVASSLGGAALKFYVQIAATQHKNVKTIAAIGSNDASIKAQITAVKDDAEKTGIKVSSFDLYPIGISDASAIVNHLEQGKPDAVFLGGPLPDVTLIIKAIRARGITTPIIGPAGGGFLSAGFAELKADSNGIMSTSAWNDDMSLPGVKRAAEEYKKRFKAPFMPQEAGESWVSVYVLTAAIERAKSAEPEKIAAALRGMTLSMGPASAMPPGKITFGAGGRNLHAMPIMVQWFNGIPHTVWPRSVSSSPIR
ncbi:hypothetical protein EPN44_10455 [bacterium]|nr:MAG: hypothetical protein EPN44_10455 [bacterium]